MHLQRGFGLPPKSPIEKYDALQDKFASFYFSGYGVKKHLKKLKKVIELEPHKKGYKQYTELLNQKLNEIEEDQKSIKSKIKPYEQSLKPSSLQKLKKIQNFFDQGKEKEPQSSSNLQVFAKNKGFFKNLPKLSKSNHIITRNGDFKTELSNSVQKTNEKDVKSRSMAENLAKDLKKEHKLTLHDRSQKSLSMSKSNAFKIKKNLERVIKQVKHEDFVMFLKKKQEGILQSKSSNHIKQEAINETIE